MRYLPTLIVFPAMWGFVSAATIYPDGFGNVTATTGNSGANNITTGSGFAPDVVITPGTKFIVINPGVTLNPTGTDVIEVAVQDSIGAAYEITNNGTLESDGGPGNYGISTADGFGSTPSITVENNGTITGAGAIRANNQLTLTNTGTLTGTSATDAAVFAKNGGDIQNGGLISANVHGIQAENGLLIVDNFGQIFGIAADGISTTGQASVTNFYDDSGSIISGGRHGILATGSGSSVFNAGVIEGISGAGVVVGDNATVVNETTYLPDGSVVGGEIYGDTFGVQAGDNLILTNELYGYIDALNGTGISSGSGASIINDWEIYGVNGISVGGGEVGNYGLITADGGTGIASTGGALIVNNTGIIDAFGGTAIQGAAGDDVINLFTTTPPWDFPGTYFGSIVDGNIDGGAGFDVLNFNGGLTSPASTANIVFGDVTNIEEINKSGAGVALIGGVGDNVTVTSDTINITGGGLYINGDVSGVSGPLATINAGGAAVGGTGTWDANLNITAGGISAGDIPINLISDPELAVGTLVITGDVDHSPGAFIRFDVIPGTSIMNGVNSDLIVQTGAATYNVDGAPVRISTTDMNRVITQGTYTIVDSEQLITGVPGELSLQLNANVIDTGFISTAYRDLIASGEATLNVSNTIFTQYFAEAYVDGTDLLLDVDYLGFDFSALPGISRNELNLIGAIGGSILDGNLVAEDFAAALLFSDLDSALGGLGALVAPAEGALAYTTSVVNSNYRLHRQIQDHLGAVRGGQTTTHTAPAPAPSGAKGGIGAKGGEVVTSSTSTTRGNVWGSFSYDYQDFDGDAGDFDGDVGSFTAGFDYQIAPNFILGFLLDGSRADIDDGPDIDSFRAALYGSWGASTGIYADFLAGYGWHDLDFTDAESFQALATIGYNFGDESVKHGPFAGLEYQNVDVDRFRSGFTDVRSFDIESLRGLIGYRVNANLGRLRPYASIAYAHEFEDGHNTARASVFGSNRFDVDGGELGSAVLVTAGTGISLTHNLLLNVGYRGEITTESDGISSHGGSIGLNWSF